MNKLKHICLTIIQLVKQAWHLPKAMGEAVTQRRARAVLKENEVERLDRIRNPSKYAGR